MLIEPANNFTFTYRRRGIPEWDFSQVMPDELEGFVRDIDPAHAIRMINGSLSSANTARWMNVQAYYCIIMNCVMNTLRNFAIKAIQKSIII